MRITFQLQETDLANNGGSSTIVNSANMLCALGHEVNLVMSEENRFSWFPLEGPRGIITKGKNYPNAEVIIATGAKSVRHVLGASQSKGKKYWYVRAHEDWVLPEENILELYRNRKLSLLVNSVDLQKYIKRRVERDSVIIHPGQDLDKFYPTKERDWNKKEWVLGGLYNIKPRKRFKWIQEIYEQLKLKGVPIKLKLFGTYKLPKSIECDEYLFRPSKRELRKFYNSIDFWLAPTKSEGLHIPPQEIMLCGGIVIGANEPLSGMSDYLDHGVTGMRFSHWPEAVGMLLNLVKNEKKMVLLSKQGREKIISLGDRKQNMEKMISYFKQGNKKIIRRAR